MISDELLKMAIDFAEDRKGCSVDSLMCRFHIGRNKASMLIDVLEREGIVEPYTGNRIRPFISRGNDVFINNQTNP